MLLSIIIIAPKSRKSRPTCWIHIYPLLVQICCSMSYFFFLHPFVFFCLSLKGKKKLLHSVSYQGVAVMKQLLQFERIKGKKTFTSQLLLKFEIIEGFGYYGCCTVGTQLNKNMHRTELPTSTVIES